MQCPPILQQVRAHASRLGCSTSDPRVRDAIAEAIKPHDDGKQYGPTGPMDTSGDLMKNNGCFAAGALRARFHQFFEESEIIIPQAVFALNKDDLEAFGKLVDRSHALTCTLLRNTVEETEWLPNAARELGAIAASAFGAGFGGSCWALTQANEADAFCSRWEAIYLEKFPTRQQTASFFVMSPGPGACCI
jgi:galactokinase